MQKITLEELDRAILIRILKYATSKKKEDCKNGKITENEMKYDIKNIDKLLNAFHYKEEKPKYF